MVATHRFSPFAQQSNSLAAERNAPGRSAASPPRAPAGRTPSSTATAETDHAQASLQGEIGRPVSGVPARRLGDDPEVQPADLLHLAARLTQGAQSAGRVARNAEILAARLSVALPAGDSFKGLTYAVNEHAEHAQLLADAHAFVVRCAAQPKMPQILAALERGEDVVIVPAHDASVLFSAADNRPARAGVVGSDVNPTLSPRKLLSGVIHLLTGHRKSSSPAHQSAPVPLCGSSTTEGTDACSNTRCETINRKVV